MILKPLTRAACQKVRRWRNDCLETLRTPYMLTESQQDKFYDSLSDSNHRYWALVENGVFVGMGGLTFIQWENSIAEISLIIDPDQRGHNFGKQAAELLLEAGFDQLNLKTIFGECYYCNDRYQFWKNLTARYDGFMADLPNRKFWSGKYHNSLYFSIDRDKWKLEKEKSGKSRLLSQKCPATTNSPTTEPVK